MKEVILNVKNLSKSYPGFTLGPISFSLQKGSITGFIGQNGAGKSTTMKAIMGLIQTDGGEIFYHGREKFSRKNIGYMGMSKDFYPDITIRDLTKFVSRAYGKEWNQDNYQNYIKKIFELDENRKMKELSTGMKVKYLIALELSKNPDLIIFDEPTSGLDPVVRDEILQILKEIVCRKEVTIFFSSHITEDIEKIADNVIFIDHGQKTLDGTKSEVLNSFVKISIDAPMSEQIKKAVSRNGILFNGYYLVEKNSLQNTERILTQPVALDEVLIAMKGDKNA